jgi:hypothetical protein
VAELGFPVGIGCHCDGPPTSEMGGQHPTPGNALAASRAAAIEGGLLLTGN